MGATLGQLKQLVDFAVGSTETRLLNNDRRVNAINRAIKSILSQFDIEQYTAEGTLTFSNGVANLPSDLMRILYIKDINNRTEYKQVDYETFSYNYGNTCYMYYDSVNKLQKIKVFPTTVASLTIWYIQKPADLSNDTDEVRFNDWWDTAIAEKATELLFTNIRNYNAAEASKSVAEDLIAKAWQTDRGWLVGRQRQKLTSVYTYNDLLYPVGYNQYTNYTAMSDNLKNLMITTSITAMPNYRYFTNSTSLIQITLPATGNINFGDIIEIVGMGTGGWLVTYNTDQYIVYGSQTTTVTTGSVSSNTQGDVIRLIYRDNGQYEVLSSIGNITYT